MSTTSRPHLLVSLITNTISEPRLTTRSVYTLIDYANGLGIGIVDPRGSEEKPNSASKQMLKELDEYNDFQNEPVVNIIVSMTVLPKSLQQACTDIKTEEEENPIEFHQRAYMK
ncbi:unnamed protein product [Timema podura]|uniref:Uncharacterized protein n=1 Tax=Timema podura TaxID=61482 RepID=A0ABN7NSC4_TIMPD|nr:unnamed protein product [Timema podura]